MATTVLALIKSALRLNNIIAASETPDANLSADMLEALNFLLGEWANDGLVIYTFEEQTFNVVSGTSEYTIGSGGTWDGNRPADIKNMIITDLDGGNNNDYPLKQYNQSDFMNINFKATLSQPTIFYYEQTYPLGRIKLYPTPEQAYTVTIASRTVFDEYTSLTTEISLPKGYLQALKFNLAINVANEFESEPSGWLVQRANETLTKIKRLNNLHRVPKMGYDRSQPGMSRAFDYRTGGF
jgi:hypothetical protein